MNGYNRKRRKKTRIANKPRFTLFCILCALIIITGISTLTNASANKNAETYSLCISAGDTLWEIARSSNTCGKDLRNVIDDIMRLNHLRSTTLQVGDVIEIPIY